MTYDFESFLEKVPQPDTQPNTEWLARHVPILVSLASNIPDHEEPICTVLADLDVLLEEMLDKLEEMKDSAAFYNGIVMFSVSTQIQSKAEEYRTLSVERSTSADVASEYEKMAEQLEKLNAQLESYVETLPVVGFNSGKYDLNLIQQRLVPLLNLDVGEEKGIVIRKQNQYSCISANHFRFLDISNYLAPHTSYDIFLKAYKCSVNKSFLPYEWFDSADKLTYDRLPDYDAFYSSLKGVNTLEVGYATYENLIAGGMTQEEALKKLHLKDVPLTGPAQYQELQNTWQSKRMQTFQDFLEEYNNIDVLPFVEAVEKMIKVYADRGISMLRDAISVPGISRISLFKCARELDVSFPLFGPEDHEIHTLFKTNVVGGSFIIVFMRKARPPLGHQVTSPFSR